VLYPISHSPVTLYLSRQATSLPRYVWEQAILSLFGWVPTIVGIGLRAVVYKLIMKTKGLVAIENGVRIRFATRSGSTRVCTWTRVSICTPARGGSRSGRDDGDASRGAARLQFSRAAARVYQDRADSLIGEFSVLRGQGALPLATAFTLRPWCRWPRWTTSFRTRLALSWSRGLRRGASVVEDDVWIGAGAILTDGVTVAAARWWPLGGGHPDVPAHTVVAGIPAKPVKTIDGSGRPEVEVYF